MVRTFRLLGSILFAASLAVSVSACSDTLQKFKAGYEAVTSVAVSPRDVVLAISAYDVIAITATNYMRLRRCNGSNGPICRDPELRQKIDAAVLSGRSARNNLKAYLRANPGITEVRLADYDTLKAATTAITDATAAYRAAR